MKLLVFPHQLYRKHPGLKRDPSSVILIEDSLFFGDFRYPIKFHKQKLWLHRATMKRYQAWLKKTGFKTKYISYDSKKTLSDHLNRVVTKSDNDLMVADPTDFILEKRLRRIGNQLRVRVEFLPNPGFLNAPEENREYRASKKRWFMADFYKWQRRRMDLLMDDDQPVGGKWSFDQDNRKKVPKKLLPTIPDNLKIKFDNVDQSAKDYVNKNFADHPGHLEQLFYPTTHAAAKRWLKHFLKHRFVNFGAYEDAIVEGESWLWHSVLTPVLNIGLLTPQDVVKETMRFVEDYSVETNSAEKNSDEGNSIPLNSIEGFLRQVIGWREFMRATYEDLGVKMRTTNHWQHHREIPSSFYDATTGIVPIDDTIRRILDTGYCHHIERLMVLGGFMFLCEFDPKAVYRWFMEMFIDSYDWVMVPNVFAMSQHADGGQITTKPYFSGSAYVRKMSHYKTGAWSEIWDGLYWRWIWNHHQQLGSNPRWAMMCSMAKKMDKTKLNGHLEVANRFLDSL